MKKVKVAFFADMLIEDFDGASRTMYQLINRIPSDQFDFLFICGTGPRMIGDFKCIHVKSLGIPGNKSYRIATVMFQKLELDAQIDNFKPDVIHIATPSMLGNFGLKTAQRLGLPVITIYHTHFVGYVDYYLRHISILADFTKDKLKNTIRNFYNQCDLVYVPSSTMIDELIQTGVHSDLMKLWQRGIDRQLFSPAKRNPEIVRQITGNGNPTVLFASRLVWEKNLQALIDLYMLIEKHNLQYNIIVAGDGVAKEDLQEQMPNAYFTGHMEHDKLSVLYASADVFFFPSSTETFGNVVLEAMASGLPCVIADGGGSRDFIVHGKNGFKCETNNAEEFLTYIFNLISEPELAQEISKNALENSKKYIWENLAKEYFNDLKSLPLAISAL